MTMFRNHLKTKNSEIINIVCHAKEYYNRGTNKKNEIKIKLHKLGVSHNVWQKSEDFKIQAR